jgi:hypothetical protein
MYVGGQFVLSCISSCIGKSSIGVSPIAQLDRLISCSYDIMRYQAILGGRLLTLNSVSFIRVDQQACVADQETHVHRAFPGHEANKN